MPDSLTPAFGVGQLHYATDGRDILLNSPDGWEVDEPWRWWDGPADSSDGAGGPWGNPPPGAAFGAPSLRGTTLPAVGQCIRLYQRIAAMPWKVYRGRELLDTPLWLADPQAQTQDGRRTLGDALTDVRFSRVEFWSQYIASYLLWGEGIAYAPRVLDEAGEPTGPIVAPLYVLHPKHVHVNDDGRYTVQDEDDPAGEHVLDARELIIIRNNVRPGYERGLGVIQAYAYDLGLAANIRTYASNMFQEGVPNGYLEATAPDLDEAEAAKLKRNWMRAHGGIRKDIAVLNATTKFHTLQLDPQVIQLVEMMRLQAWQVCLIFGVPPSKLGINMGQSNTYSNLESDNANFVNDTLMDAAAKLEAAVDAKLAHGTDMKIDFRQLLRGDTKTRYEAYQIGLAAGFLSKDEVREWEDLAPLTQRLSDEILAGE